LPNVYPHEHARNTSFLPSPLTLLSYEECLIAVTTELINALHFRRGIQNMQVVNMEWEIPIPPKPIPSHPIEQPTTNGFHRRLSRKRITHNKNSKSHSRSKSLHTSPPATYKSAKEETVRRSYIETGSTKLMTTTGTSIKRDWTIVQKAWWDTILLMQANPGTVRVALEMRIMGSSDIILAPQRGNKLGTCSIEILTTLNTPRREWEKFCQKVTDTWVTYRDGTTGKRLHVRPHWCKQWSFLQFSDECGREMSAVQWMRKVAYKDEITEFMNGLTRIGQSSGFTINDLRARFGNEFLESIFWGGPEGDSRVSTTDSSRERLSRLKRWLKKLL